MAEKLVALVEESESKLPAGDRAWLSTENLESLFGQYKRLEGQHSKGGFTSLIAALPMLLTHWTPTNVHVSLTAARVKAMQHWLRDNLETTLTSKRATHRLPRVRKKHRIAQKHLSNIFNRPSLPSGRAL
jgi:hypothetical protein